MLSCSSKGCFVKFGDNTVGRATLSDLSHKHISHPEIEFYPGKLVLCRIVNIRNNGFLDISLKELIVKFGIELGLD